MGKSRKRSSLKVSENRIKRRTYLAEQLETRIAAGSVIPLAEPALGNAIEALMLSESNSGLSTQQASQSQLNRSSKDDAATDAHDPNASVNPDGSVPKIGDKTQSTLRTIQSAEPNQIVLHGDGNQPPVELFSQSSFGGYLPEGEFGQGTIDASKELRGGSSVSSSGSADASIANPPRSVGNNVVDRAGTELGVSGRNASKTPAGGSSGNAAQTDGDSVAATAGSNATSSATVSQGGQSQAGGTNSGTASIGQSRESADDSINDGSADAASPRTGVAGNVNRDTVLSTNQQSVVITSAEQVRAGDYERIVVEGHLRSASGKSLASAPEGNVSVDFYVVKRSELQIATARRLTDPVLRNTPRHVHVGSTTAIDGDFRAVIDASILPGDSVFAVASRSNETPYRSAPVSVGFGDDLDRDGVNDAVELNGPRNGDANGDGRLDRLQAGVATVPSSQNGEFVTFDAHGAPLRNVRALSSFDANRGDISLPFGMFDFEVLVRPGGAATVDIILPQSASPNAYYKQDAIGGTLAPFRFDGQTGAVVNGNVITVYLQDGGRGDADGQVNGVIVDPGAMVDIGGIITLAGTSAQNVGDWNIEQFGGSNLASGYVSEETVDETQYLRIHEGDSFHVSMSRTITIPEDPSEFRFEYEADFNTTDADGINDAFEVAILNDQGYPVIEPFRSSRDSFFNHTEGESPAFSTGVTDQVGFVTADISSLPAGAEYTLTLRMINNDGDSGSNVRLRASHNPRSNDDSVNLLEDSTDSSFDVLANDTSFLAGDDALSITAVDITGTIGQVSIQDGLLLRYVPVSDFNGIDSAVYTVYDSVAESSSTATVVFNVTPVNDAPTITGFSIDVDEDQTLTLSIPGVLAYADDIDDPPDNLALSVIAPTEHGDLTWSTDGSITYTPSENFNGSDSFIMQVNDGKDSSSLITVPITIQSVNDIGGEPDLYNTNEDVVLDVPIPGVLANDVDVENDLLIAIPLSAGTKGNAVLNSDGSFIYTPNPNDYGIDTFTYQVFDGHDYSAPITATVNIAQVNDPPVAEEDSYTTDEETPLAIAAPGILFNDDDPEDHPLTSVHVAGGTNGTITVEDDGSFVYTPADDFFGEDTFWYYPTDGNASGSATLVTIDVVNINDAPQAIDNAYNVAEDHLLTVDEAAGLVSDDLDVDFDVLSVTEIVDNPDYGTIESWDPNGFFQYRPDPDFNGNDSFSYETQDPDGETATATVWISVDPINDAPVAAADANLSATEDQALVFAGSTLLANDLDVDGDDLTFNLLGFSEGGVVADIGGGDYQFTPDADFDGEFTFWYEANDGFAQSEPVTVTINVHSVNDAPIATDDGPYLYVADAANLLVVSAAAGLLLNDDDVDGDLMETTLASQGNHGVATINPDGSFSYQPADPNWFGTDTFTYVANDSVLDSTPASVTVIVDHAPVANDDTFSVDEDTQLIRNEADGVLSNDYDVDGTDLVIAEVISPPANASQFSFESDGGFSFTGDQNFSGTTTFTYRLWDGHVYSSPAVATITVAGVNDSPLSEDDIYHFTFDGTNPLIVGPSEGLLSNDSDVEEDLLHSTLESTNAGTVTVQPDGSFRYTPSSGFSGADTFTYRANDAAPGTLATVTIHVNNVPVAVDDSSDPLLNTSEDSTLDIALSTVLANDTDQDNDILTAELVTDATDGTVTRGPGDSFVYLPNEHHTGADSFTYRVNDGNAFSDEATVHINVAPVNDAPEADDDSYSVTEDAVLTVANPGLLGNDFDVDGDLLSAEIVSGPSHGTITDWVSDGGFTYDSDPNFEGTDTFVYRTFDGNLYSNSVTVSINVQAENDAPTATADNYSTQEDVPLYVAADGVLDNDDDPDGPTLSANLVSSTTNGTLQLETDGSFTYTPNPDFNGIDSFVYQATDGEFTTSDTSVVITVTPANDAPTVENFIYNILEDEPVSQAADGVLTGAADLDSPSFTAVLMSQPTYQGTVYGSVTLEIDGSFEYTPAQDFHGTVSFTFAATDGQDVSTPGTVTINHAPVNDYPQANDYAMDFVFRKNVVETLALGSPGLIELVSDVDGDQITTRLAAGGEASNGVATVDANGLFTYSPDHTFFGSDSFQFEGGDGSAWSDPATFTINVYHAPFAVGDGRSTDEDVPLTISKSTLLANDIDVDGGTLSVTDVTLPSHGSLVDQGDGTLVYTPVPNFNGADSFTYRASDGVYQSEIVTVDIVVTAINDAPAVIDDPDYVYIWEPSGILTVGDASGVLANDLDADFDVLSTTNVSAATEGNVNVAPDGSFTYTPDSGFAGLSTFTYTANDGTVDSAAAATASIYVTHRPAAVGESFNVTEDQAFSPLSSLLDNDSDIDEDSLIAELGDDVSHGTLTLETNGSFTYAPEEDYNGPDHFTYRASDGVAHSDWVTVALTIEAVNDAPVASPDSYSGPEDEPVIVPALGVLANDNDPEENPLVAVLHSASDSRLQFNSDGSFTFTPQADSNDPFQFEYYATDGEWSSEVVVVSLSIDAVNDSPVASSDQYSVDEDQVLSVGGIGVLEGDHDVDHDLASLTVTRLSSPTNGSLTWHGDGTFDYTPNQHFSGTDSFT
ncbi:hypothetical protein Enr13x_53530 [Stieleria neptunia]|uniref:Tandem-95 repeat protein n=1 Tax=Stieleria neptunia TaxID=2527979 RepID=A0A518HXJ6_9BACT|nr:Ig-like domain-containing protein [Stieleria neptunia]QDV45474.1 hypothetical protein Enr13x_53530 [Stieleria neptunia]